MSRKCLRKLIVQQRIKAATHGGRHENGSAHAMNGEKEAQHKRRDCLLMSDVELFALVAGWTIYR